MKANDLKPGMAVTMDGQLFAVIKTDHVKPGKGPAYVQAKLKNLMTGSHVEKRLGSSDTVDGATLDRRECEYLYDDGTDSVFMDSETFDQFQLDEDTLGENKLYLVPNLKINIQFHDNNPVNIELPGSVEMKVVETPPGIKGATVTNQLKEATLETGLKTRVPPFIEEGEIIKVSTTTGEYQSRA
jgi:elongation factor P